jgi:phage terminase large subunit-like protein
VRTRISFELFDPQADALESSIDELLIGSDESGHAGTSFTLRAIGAILCFERPGLRAVLIQRDESKLRRDHLEGTGGLINMLAESQRERAVTVTPVEVRFDNGSSLRWSGCTRETEVARLLEQPIDVLLVDEVNDVPEPLYRRLRERVLSGVHPARRIVAASNRISQGWPAAHWNGVAVPGRGYIPMRPNDLDVELREGDRPIRFRDYIEQVRPGFRWLKHTELIVQGFQDLVDGVHENLAVFLPPQHGKSEIGPRLGAAYCLERYPSDWIGIACYGAAQANKRNANARDFYRRGGGKVKFGAGGVNMWESLFGGGSWSAGVDSGVTGNPMSLGIIDDPDKDYADAINPRRQVEKQTWYRDVWRARESMFGETTLSQLLIQTRWDVNDTGSYVLKRAALAGERWHIICLPALYDPEVTRQFTDPDVVAEVFGKEYAELFPKLFTVEKDWRTSPGEAIWPEKRSREKWENFRDNVVGPFIFSAEWQQNPRPAVGGGVFDRTWFQIIYEPLAATLRETACRAWDDGSVEGKGDSTAGVLMERYAIPKKDFDVVDEQRTVAESAYVVAHAIEAKIHGSKVKPLKVETAARDGRNVYVKIPQDAAAAGKTDSDATVEALVQAGQPRDRIVQHKPTGSKLVRARDLSSAASTGSVKILVDEHGWVGGGYDGSVAIKPVFGGDERLYGGSGSVSVARLLEQMHRFTGADGQEDDLVDAMVDAHAQVAKPRSRITVF